MAKECKEGRKLMSRHEKNLSSRFPTRSDTNRAIQPQKMTRGLKFWIYLEDGLYNQCSENKDDDLLCGYRIADLPLFSHMQKAGFLMISHVYPEIFARS